jgi:TolA-binding protein
LPGIGKAKIVSLRRITAAFGLLATLAASGILRPQEAAAMQAAFRAGSEADTLSVTSESGSLPAYNVRRTGAKEITVTFAAGERPPAAPGVGGSKLVSGVRPTPGGFKILLKTSAFSYVNSANADKSRLNVQIFQDDVGSMWGESGAKAKPAQAEKKPAADKKAEKEAATDKAAAKKAEAQKLKAERQAEKLKKEQARAEAEQKNKAEAEAKAAKVSEEARHAHSAKAAPAAQPAHAAPPAAPAIAPAAAPAIAPAAAHPVPAPAPAAPAMVKSPSQLPDASQGQPFFSVPYSMRAPVNKTVVGLPPAGTATLPPVSGQPQPAAPPQTAPQAPAKQPPRQPALQTGGKLPPGVVEKPILQEQTTSAPAASPASTPAQANPLSMPPTPGPTVDVTPDKGQKDVRFRAERHGPADARPAEVLSGHAAGKPPAAPGQQAALAAKPWEMRQQIQKTVVPTGAAASATMPQVGGAASAQPESAPHAPSNATSPTPAPQPTTNASSHGPATPPAANATHPAGHGPEAAANASEHGPTAKDGGKEGAKAPEKGGHGGGEKDKQQGPLTVEQIKDQLLKAQSDMVAGKWQEAVQQIENLMREPNMKGDLREETLYSLADTYMQAYRDNMAANFDKIAGAQMAAMNANQKSHRVPKALLNLGLLNLKVGNIKEAIAYFNVLKKRYPHDQNASIIPFSLGEYYREKGDLKKAAEQYQKLIQDYPDSRMTKETAYILAQTLRKLGNYDKAYQIADYIDKRWPLFYMENPQFLKLAGEIEEKVGKLQQAKDHYWTYYNINPKDELADLTLVRIGDIYLREGKRAPAKEVYQKVVHDFPDRDGAQIARMRIAEEGIFDDPTMGDMGSVFGRSEALKPNETYQLIMSKYPKSPLAPLAHLKLGMWQFYTKAYLDAMNTASSFLEKYPKSPFAAKASELGFQAFLQALPQLVQDGNYARVLQLYDSSPFVKDNHAKLGDESQMAVAVSAWKRGDPDRALKLAGRFLGKKQVPKYSEMALDLAMNIFVERKEWKRIAELATRAGKAWKLSPRQKSQFEIARAMALDNAGEVDKSLPLWTRIASDQSSDPATRAHATYVLAKEAARKQDMVRLFALSQEALGQLLATRGDPEKIKDCMLMAITATERSGRYTETIKWSSEFDKIIPPSDPDWAPVRLRLADIYRRGGMTGEWKTLLTDIVKKKPNTVYSRMASQALETNALDQRLQNYLTKPNR